MRKFSAQLRNQAKDDGILYQVEFSCKPIQECSPGIDMETRKKLEIWKIQLKHLKEQYFRYKTIYKLKAHSEKLNELKAEIAEVEYDIEELKKSMGGGG